MCIRDRARRRGPLPALLDALCTLPLVLPPTVLGYYLILIAVSYTHLALAVGRVAEALCAALAEARGEEDPVETVSYTHLAAALLRHPGTLGRP